MKASILVLAALAFGSVQSQTVPPLPPPKSPSTVTLANGNLVNDSYTYFANGNKDSEEYLAQEISYAASVFSEGSYAQATAALVSEFYVNYPKA